MMLIGVDPHKSTHTATAVEPGTNREIASIRIESDGAQVTYNFLAEEHQQESQNKAPLAPMRELKHTFDDLCEKVRKTSTLKNSAARNKKNKGGG